MVRVTVEAMDPVFLITGASSGIGAATARHAAQAGYRLVLGARTEEKLEALQQELGGPERTLIGKLDVTSWDDQQALVRQALDRYGRLDVAFANAGVGHEKGFEAGDPEDVKAMILTNVYGPYLTIRAAASALRASKGQILITSSIAGRRALAGSLYSSTKFAATGMAEAARLDFNDTGVRVTLIEPGMVETPGFPHPELDEALTADDIARAVIYAVSQPPHVDVNEILIRPTAQRS
jgi:NADP-dependent 3-hydroxy acid dehydrogenase YdfG